MAVTGTAIAKFTIHTALRGCHTVDPFHPTSSRANAMNAIMKVSQSVIAAGNAMRVWRPSASRYAT